MSPEKKDIEILIPRETKPAIIPEEGGEIQPLVRREIIDVGEPGRGEAEEVVERKVIETPSRFGKEV